MRVVVSVMVPLVAITLAGRQDLALFAVFGALASVYGRAESHRSRLRTQTLAGCVLVVCVGLGAAVATTGTVRPWLAVVIAALVAAVGSLISDALRWRPPGPFFLVFAFGAVSAIPAPGPAAIRVATAVAVAVGSAVFAVLVGSVAAVDSRRRRSDPPSALDLGASLRRPGIWRPTARYFVAALVGGAIATGAGFSHPYWAALTAVVPMAATDTNTRLLRAAHRLLGTGLGLLVAAPLLALHPSGWLLVGMVGAAQFGAELFATRNYSLALIFITPLALLATSLGGQVDPDQVLLHRALETVIGVAVGILATLLWSERERADLART